jgi:hypothetical protein
MQRCEHHFLVTVPSVNAASVMATARLFGALLVRCRIHPQHRTAERNEHHADVWVVQEPLDLHLLDRGEEFPVSSAEVRVLRALVPMPERDDMLIRTRDRGPVVVNDPDWSGREGDFMAKVLAGSKRSPLAVAVAFPSGVRFAGVSRALRRTLAKSRT